MRIHSIKLVTLFIIIFFIYFIWKITYIYLRITNSNSLDVENNKIDSIIKNSLFNLSINLQKQKLETIYIALVCCGDRVQEALNVIKSALLFTKRKLYFIIVCDNELFLTFNEKLTDWQSKVNFEFKTYPLSFPEDDPEWKKLFKLCASQRLFLPNILQDIDALLYVDTDTLFLSPVEDIWSHFYKMNKSQIAALTPEHEDPNIGWYNRFARHPYYGEFGVNSGVMLMNLTRMRKFQWTKYVIPIYNKYKFNMTWGDQDIINILFYYHPDKLYTYPCRYNFRPDHCMYMNICKSAEKHGIAVLHGSRGYFHSEKQPFFGILFRTFLEYELEKDPYRNFYLSLETYLESEDKGNCMKMKNTVLKFLRNYIEFSDL